MNITGHPLTNPPNVYVVSLASVIQNINPELLRQFNRSLNNAELVSLYDIYNHEYDLNEFRRIYNIIRIAFDYILIRDMINGALNNEGNHINQLLDINPDLFNIIRYIYNDRYGRVLLTYILENM